MIRMSVAEKVDDLNSIKESFARAEKLAEEVILGEIQ